MMQTLLGKNFIGCFIYFFQYQGRQLQLGGWECADVHPGPTRPTLCPLPTRRPILTFKGLTRTT